ncbi:hypothetical protein ES703_15338 [subsurface metagenome]
MAQDHQPEQGVPAMVVGEVILGSLDPVLEVSRAAKKARANSTAVINKI